MKQLKLDQKPLTAMELNHSAEQVCVNFVTGGLWDGQDGLGQKGSFTVQR